MGKFQDVVTVFLTHRSKILVLKRSGEVGTYKGRWAGVSGYLESNNALAQAHTEMAEEVGLGEEDVTLLKAGKPLEIVDDAQDRAGYRQRRVRQLGSPLLGHDLLHRRLGVRRPLRQVPQRRADEGVPDEREQGRDALLGNASHTQRPWGKSDRSDSGRALLSLS